MSDARAFGTGASVRALGRTLVDILRTRLELLAVEGAQMQNRLGRLALLAGLGLLSLLMCVVLVAGLAVAFWWDTPYRLAAIAALALLFAVGAAGCAVAVVRAMRAAPRPLDATLRCLAADIQALA
jgi:uncharacterized membrane protein YqjE